MAHWHCHIACKHNPQISNNRVEQDKLQTARWNTTIAWLLCPHHSSPSGANVRNQCSYTSTPLIHLCSMYRGNFTATFLLLLNFCAPPFHYWHFIMSIVIAIICILITNYTTIFRKSSIFLPQSHHLLCYTTESGWNLARLQTEV
jgi:hypothetical protein